MSHARMKTVFLHFSKYLPWSIFLLLQLLENLVFVEFPRFLFDFIILKKKKHFGGNEVRFTSKNCKRDKSFISFINFLYALLALKMILSNRVAKIFFAVPYRILDTEGLSSILTDLLLLFTASL